MIDDGTGLRERIKSELLAVYVHGEQGLKSPIGEIADRIAALSAVAPPPVLEGWVLVPRKPTDAMLVAGRNAHEASGRFIDTWAAMLAASPAAPAQPEGGEAVEFVRVCNALGIGEQARTVDCALTNIRNLQIFAAHLHAIEREFFMVPGEPDEDYPDDEPEPDCLLNSWGSTTPQYVEQFRSALERITRPAPAQQAVTDEMKELLHSTHEIALRGGADTHWEALAKSIAKLGIAPITARHYFADGTPREAINRHLNALSSRINAARAALTSTAAKAAEGAK